MKKYRSILPLFALLFFVIPNEIAAHCEVPCGIYEDSLRVKLIREHITTIEKAMKKIKELSSAKEINYNQIVRWVNNKEEHAEKIQEIVSQYFVHQRVKIKAETDEGFAQYQKQLTQLHHISVYAMKCKQSLDLENIKKINAAVDGFEKVYFHAHDHKHDHKHDHGGKDHKH